MKEKKEMSNEMKHKLSLWLLIIGLIALVASLSSENLLFTVIATLYTVVVGSYYFKATGGLKRRK